MKHLKLIAILMAILIVTLPICFATEINLQYDTNGNLVTGDGLYRTYNSLNQLSKVYNGSNSSGTLLQEYTYDPVEERVAIKKDYTKNETTYYFTQSDVRIVNISGTYDYKYAYFNGELVAQINPDGSKYWIHGDLKGSSSVVTNQSGSVIENTSYSPYGDVLSGGTKSRYNYENKEYDSVIQSTDFHFRQMGINGIPVFQQPDTLIQNVYDPQSLNRYSFERNNPYKYTDPTGHTPVLIILAIVMVIFIYIEDPGIIDVVGLTLVDIWDFMNKPKKTPGPTFEEILNNENTCYKDNSYPTFNYETPGFKDILNTINLNNNQDQNWANNPETEVDSFSHNGKTYTIKIEATDSEGKTEWERQIEANKKASAEKEAQGLSFKGYDSDGKGRWE